MNWMEWANIGSAVALSSALNAAGLGLLIAALAAAVVRSLPRSNATTRYAIWLTAFALVLAAPVALLLAPHTPAVAVPVPAPVVPAPISLPATAGWPIYALIAWATIAGILLARVGWSLSHIRSLKRNAILVEHRGSIRLLASPDVRVPMAAGFFRRAILFPQWAFDQLSPQEFEQVLAHELAHLRRWDDWTQLAQAAAEAVLFFNPALYWIGRHLKIEREIACDDWVVTATGKARPYAACLTHVHELTRRVPAPQLAPGAANGKRWQISARIEALLSADRNVTPRFSRSGWIAAAALAGVALFLTAEAPPLAGVAPLPVLPLPMARLRMPAAPSISLTPHRPAPARPFVLAARFRPPASPISAAALPLAKPAAQVVQVVSQPAQYVLVSQWRSNDTPRTYWLITVVFLQTSPTLILEGI